MKKLLVIIISLLALTACHNEIWDKLNDHEARIVRLETLCNQFNTNISALQVLVEAINARDYIKDIVPVTENGRTIGYTISFNGRNPVTIYNGQNGEDGHTPIIGLKSEDGVWYWTLDGEWIRDDVGNKVRADGATPQLRIEADYWWVSYDNGATWSQLGPAGIPARQPSGSSTPSTAPSVRKTSRSLR